LVDVEMQSAPVEVQLANVEIQSAAVEVQLAVVDMHSAIVEAQSVTGELPPPDGGKQLPIREVPSAHGVLQQTSATLHLRIATL
jgi:hypothetical protein